MFFEKNSSVLPGFNGCDEDARGVLLGCPWEERASFRHGAAKAPMAIRNYVADHVGRFGPDVERAAPEALWDAGDVSFHGSDDERGALYKIELAAASLQRDGRLLFAVGGSHGITYPLLRTAHGRYPDLHYLAIDAHDGLAEGKVIGHHTYLQYCLQDFFPKEQTRTFGLRRNGGIPEGRDFRVKERPSLQRDVMEEMTTLAKVPLYVSICLDVLDPSLMPAMIRPSFGGIGSDELLRTIFMLSGLHVVAMDLVGLVPALDNSGVTTALAAEFVQENFLYFLGKGLTNRDKNSIIV